MIRKRRLCTKSMRSIKENKKVNDKSTGSAHKVIFERKVSGHPSNQKILKGGEK